MIQQKLSRDISKSLYNLFLSVLIFITFCALCSCSQLFECERGGNGVASISLTLPAAKRALDMEPHGHAQFMTEYYEVSFIRQGLSDVVIRGNPGETVNSGELLVGMYAVECYAYSYEGKRIGYGKKSDVYVADGETTFITISISEIKEPTTAGDIETFSVTFKNPDETSAGDSQIFSEGDTLAFAAAKSAINSVPSGREVVAFKCMETNTIYKKSDFPITFNGTNFSSSDVTLQSILDFTYSKDPNYGYADLNNPVLQNGTFECPYLMNFCGSESDKQLMFIISDNTCANSDLTMTSSPDYIDITHTDNKFLCNIKPIFTVNNVYVSIITLTVTDPETGATKDIYMLIKKNT